MKETGSYPGQPCLWLYDLRDSVPGFSSSANVDLIAIYVAGAGALNECFCSHPGGCYGPWMCSGSRSQVTWAASAAPVSPV